MGETLHIFNDSLRHTQAFWSGNINWTVFSQAHEKTEQKPSEHEL